jgi:hypothetical protein
MVPNRTIINHNETSLTKGQAPGGRGRRKLFTEEITYDCDDGGDYSDKRNRAACWRPFFLRRGILDLSSLFIKLFSLPPHKIVRISHLPFSIARPDKSKD